MVDPDTAVTIRSAEPVEVVIAGLAIEAPFVWGADRSWSVGVMWEQTEIDKTQTIVIKDSEITSFIGVGISSKKGSLTVQQSRLQSIATGIGVRTRGEITVAVEDTSLDGPFTYGIPDLSSLVISSAVSFMPDDSPGKASISLKNNQIQFWHLGFKAISVGYEGWSRAEALLVDNTIAYNKVGVHLAGDTDAEFRENTISNNDNGVTLFLPPCASIKPGDILAFRGTVRGQDNVVMNNEKGNLCPADYPWPPGFRKP
jgi:parallel beta-helix repeat protein